MPHSGQLRSADITTTPNWYPAAVAATPIAPFTIAPLPTTRGEQANFIFKPEATRGYTFATVGPADSRVVIFEDRDSEPRHMAGSDDAGTDENAEISGKFVAGRTCHIRVRVAHADGDRPVGLALR